MYRKIFLIGLAVVGANFLPLAAAEEIYKCTGEDGKVLYQRGPCKDASQSDKKDIDPNKNVIQMPSAPAPAPVATGTSSGSATGNAPGAGAPGSGDADQAKPPPTPQPYQRRRRY